MGVIKNRIFGYGNLFVLLYSFRVQLKINCDDGAFKQVIAYMKSIYSERLGRTRLKDLTRLIAFIFHIVFIKGRLKAEKSFQTAFFH